jgi:RimJ/RimL family protein N-acetyltransferase
MVRTARLLGRRPCAADAAFYRELLLAAEVRTWLRPPPLPDMTDEDPDALLADDIEHWANHGFGPWVLLDRHSGAFLGRGGLGWTIVGGRLRVQLPWAIVPSRWGEGLATEAALAALEEARRMGFEEIVAFALPDNTPSRRVMEKAGLEYIEDVGHAGLTHVLYGARLTGEPPD